MKIVLILLACYSGWIISYLIAYYFLDIRPALKKAKRILKSQPYKHSYELFDRT